MSFTFRILAGNAIVVAITVIVLSILAPGNHLFINIAVGAGVLAASSIVLWLLCNQAFKPLEAIVSNMEKQRPVIFQFGQ